MDISYTKKGEIRLKKVVGQPDKWIKNVAKAKRSHGEAYISGGKLRPAKHVQPPCGERCIHKCAVKFTAERRLAIFNRYWSLGDLTLQRAFILNLIKTVLPKYRRTKIDPKRNRSLNYAYHFSISDSVEPIRVCKTFFMNTLHISYVTVETAIRKFNAEKGVLQGEKRGKHPRKMCKSHEIN